MVTDAHGGEADGTDNLVIGCMGRHERRLLYHAGVHCTICVLKAGTKMEMNDTDASGTSRTDHGHVDNAGHAWSVLGKGKCLFAALSLLVAE